MVKMLTIGEPRWRAYGNNLTSHSERCIGIGEGYMEIQNITQNGMKNIRYLNIN
jgi:hypothetical protein